MKLKVVYMLWGADGFDEPLGGGTHDLEDVTEEQARSIAGAAASGVVEVLEASKAEQKLLDGHVQSQEDGEAAWQAAFESGDWHVGNLQNYVATGRARLEGDGKFEPGEKRRLAESIIQVNAELEQRTGEPVTWTPEISDAVEIGSADVAALSTVVPNEVNE